MNEESLADKLRAEIERCKCIKPTSDIARFALCGVIGRAALTLEKGDAPSMYDKLQELREIK